VRFLPEKNDYMVTLDQQLRSHAYSTLDHFERSDSAIATIALFSAWGPLLIESVHPADTLPSLIETIIPCALSSHASEEWQLSVAENALTMTIDFSIASLSLCAALFIEDADLSWNRAYRFESLAMLDCFVLACRSSVDAFNAHLTSIAERQLGFVSTCAAEFSPQVRSVMLVNSDDSVYTEAVPEPVNPAILGFFNELSRDVDDLIGLTSEIIVEKGDAIYRLSPIGDSDTQLFLRGEGSTAPGIISCLGVLVENACARIWRTNPPAPVSRPNMHLVALSRAAVFHRDTCHSISARPAATLRGFETRASAIKSGLRPCSSCNP
jgi:hypothetical protein